MTPQFTPGPLCVTKRKPSHDCYGADAIECLIHVGDVTNMGNAIASVSLGGRGGTSTAPEDVRANALLFASAPDLYAALVPFLDPDVHLKFMGDKDGRIYLSVTKEEYDAARAALAKATP